MMKFAKALFVCAFIAVASTAVAQQTTGSIAGRVIDDLDAGIPGAAVAARNLDTGFLRETTSGENGVYRLAGLPVGTYRVEAQRAGLVRFERDGLIVNVARTTDVDIILRVPALTETVTVAAEVPLLPVTSSTVGEIVDTARIEGLPLNGRQFANLAATVPGVGLGFHSDLTKATQ